MGGCLGLIPTGSHIAPPSTPGGGAIHEQFPAAGVRADSQSVRSIIRQKRGEGPGNRRPGLVKAIPDPRHSVSVPLRTELELVVVQAMFQDVVQVANSIRGDDAVVDLLFGGRADDRSQVVEALEAVGRLIRLMAQAGALHGGHPVAEQVFRPEPTECGRHVRQSVHGAPTIPGQRVDEAQKEIWLGSGFVIGDRSHHR